MPTAATSGACSTARSRGSRAPRRVGCAAASSARMTVERLLHALADGQTHSGEELARAFGVTRAAIWKQVAKLADWGLAVEAAAGAGYRLPRRLDLLDTASLRAALDAEVAARLAKLEVFTESIRRTAIYSPCRLPWASSTSASRSSRPRAEGGAGAAGVRRSAAASHYPSAGNSPACRRSRPR